MTDLVQLFEDTADLFGRRVHAVADDQWQAPTPCADWDVRSLVNHVVGEQLWAPHLLGGETIEEVGDRYDGDLLGEDPKRAWDAAVGPSIEAFRAPGALDRTVHLSYGDEAAREYAVQMLTDLAIHGWDLARATGGDERIDPDVAELLWATWSPRKQMLEGTGVFAAPIDLSEDAPTADRLLGLLGRRP